MTKFNTAAAKKAGYSEVEIAHYLVSSGRAEEEVHHHLGTAPRRTLAPATTKTTKSRTLPKGHPLSQKLERQPTVGTAHEFSSTQVNLPTRISEHLRLFGKAIPTSKLAEGGLESEPHITVKYGNPSADPDPIRKALQGEPPIRVTFGKLSIFPAADTKSATGDTDVSDVLKVDIHSADLHRLNRIIGAAVAHTGNTHPAYSPHATVGYLKPGEGKQYQGRHVPGITGRSLTLQTLTFCSKDGRKTEVRLAGKGPSHTGTPSHKPVKLDSATVSKLVTPPTGSR